MSSRFLGDFLIGGKMIIVCFRARDPSTVSERK